MECDFDDEQSFLVNVRGQNITQFSVVMMMPMSNCVFHNFRKQPIFSYGFAFSSFYLFSRFYFITFDCDDDDAGAVGDKNDEFVFRNNILYFDIQNNWDWVKIDWKWNETEIIFLRTIDVAQSIELRFWHGVEGTSQGILTLSSSAFNLFTINC